MTVVKGPWRPMTIDEIARQDAACAELTRAQRQLRLQQVLNQWLGQWVRFNTQGEWGLAIDAVRVTKVASNGFVWVERFGGPFPLEMFMPVQTVHEEVYQVADGVYCWRPRGRDP